MLRTLLILAVVSTAASVVGRNAGGEDSESPADADQITDVIVILGVRPDPLAEVPGASTDVLFTDDFIGEQKTLADLLSEAEGIYVRRFGGAGDPSELSIRGSSPSQVAVSIDGVRANSILTGGFDLSRVCLPLLDRVEITRGAGSTQGGSGAVGGAVNLVTKGPEDSPPALVNFSAGSFDTYEGSILHSSWLGPLDYTVGYCGFATEGDFEFARPTETIDGVVARFEPDTATRVNNDRIQHGGTLALSAPLASGVLRLSDYVTYAESGEPGVDSGNGVTAGQSTEARSRDFSNLAQLRWEGASPIGLGGELKAAVHNRYERTRFKDPMVLFREPIDVRAELTTTAARVEDAWRDMFFGQEHALKLQVDAAHDSLSSETSADRTRFGGALDETLRLLGDRIALSAGARLEHTETFDTEFLPAFGLVVTPFPWIRLRGQIGRAYRVPSFDELFHPDEGFIRGNPDLSPEDAWNMDAGFEVRLDEAWIASEIGLRAAWFRREIDESIVWVLINPQTIAPVNTGEGTAEGYELSASLRLSRFLRISGNHTETDSTRDATRERLPGQPDSETFGRVQLGPERVWKLVGEVQHVGEILVNEGGSRRLTARTIWNASASLNLSEWPNLGLVGLVPELWVSVAVDNIGDRAVRDAISFPQPGRSLTAGIEGRW